MKGDIKKGVKALTPRERQALAALIEHGHHQAAAHALGIKYQTSKNLISKAIERLGCETSLQACVIFDRARNQLGLDRRSGGDRRSGSDRRISTTDQLSIAN